MLHSWAAELGGPVRMEASPRRAAGASPGSRLDADALPASQAAGRLADESGEPDEEYDDDAASSDAAESYAELRPSRRLRLTQLAPIALLSLMGSLMFAFPLAFAFDQAG